MPKKKSGAIKLQFVYFVGNCGLVTELIFRRPPNLIHSSEVEKRDTAWKESEFDIRDFSKLLRDETPFLKSLNFELNWFSHTYVFLKKNTRCWIIGHPSHCGHLTSVIREGKAPRDIFQIHIRRGRETSIVLLHFLLWEQTRRLSPNNQGLSSSLAKKGVPCPTPVFQFEKT